MLTTATASIAYGGAREKRRQADHGADIWRKKMAGGMAAGVASVQINKGNVEDRSLIGGVWRSKLSYGISVCCLQPLCSLALSWRILTS